MTREEKQKAIDAIKISAPFMAMTQEEYNNYIQTRIKLIDWLEQESCDDCISRQAVLDLVNADWKYEGLEEPINSLPPVNLQKPSISEDGTLTVNVEDGSKVSRVLVCGDNHFGGLYYPNQEPKTGWIPVSEGLPKKFSYVNCTCRSLIDDRASWVIETCYVPQPSNSPYSDWGNIPMLNHGECEVIAWMYREIPKPYKAESEEDGNDKDN